MRYRAPLAFFLIMLYAIAVTRLTTLSLAQQTNQTPPQPQCRVSFPLPNASEIGTKKFEKLLYDFLDQGCYKKWVSDSQIRNTGPFINRLSYGTHGAVKILYSPEAWEWLKVKDRQGDIV